MANTQDTRVTQHIHIASGLCDALRRLIFRDIFSTLRHSSEGRRERKREERKRETDGEGERKIRSIISRNVRRGDATRDFRRSRARRSLRDEEDEGCRRNCNSRVLNNAYQKSTLGLAFRVFPTASSSFRRSNVVLSPSFSSFFFPAPYRPSFPLVPLSAVFITHRRHGARLHYPASILAWPGKIGHLSRSGPSRHRPRRSPRVFFRTRLSPFRAAFSCFRSLLFFRAR